MEDGEIKEDVTGATYHPSLEFPGEDEEHSGSFDAAAELPSASTLDATYEDSSLYDSSRGYLDQPGPSSAHSSTPPPSSSSSAHTLRLLVRRTGILSRAQRIALLDGYAQVEIGRDAPASSSAPTPRIRLKEMEVSKVHATLYWDGARREWAVVDMGSKHGTFVKSSGVDGIPIAGSASGPPSAPGGDDPRGQRLSLPRVSSVPRRLRHLDEMSLGSTTFIVHIHADHVPCSTCSPKGGDEIPLFHDKSSRAELSRKRQREAESVVLDPAGRDGRKALSMLKRSLLSRRTDSPATLHGVEGSSKSASYIDRSAKRRALHTASTDAPGVDESRFYASAPQSALPSRSASVTPSPPVSAPPTPLPASNVGHRLLMKQGWTPGSVLGAADAQDDPVEGSIALVEPLSVAPRASRAGLGADVPAPNNSNAAASSGLSWQDEGKYRRWNNLELSGS